MCAPALGRSDSRLRGHESESGEELARRLNCPLRCRQKLLPDHASSHPCHVSPDLAMDFGTRTTGQRWASADLCNDLLDAYLLCTTWPLIAIDSDSGAPAHLYYCDAMHSIHMMRCVHCSVTLIITGTSTLSCVTAIDPTKIQLGYVEITDRY